MESKLKPNTAKSSITCQPQILLVKLIWDKLAPINFLKATNYITPRAWASFLFSSFFQSPNHSYSFQISLQIISSPRSIKFGICFHSGRNKQWTLFPTGKLIQELVPNIANSSQINNFPFLTFKFPHFLIKAINSSINKYCSK